MQLSRIEATNFGAYGRVDLDLTDAGLCVVTGPNGAGKSTLFTDIPRFAFFGSSRTGSVDDLVREGTEQMSVTVQFLLGGTEYRVVRSRSKKGRGKSGLELHVRDGAEWKPLTADNVRATEARIAELLKISEETFVASCMILQGRSNEFTTKTPAERKAVLFQVLNLQLYERLKDRAHERARALDGELKVLKERHSGILEQLRAEPDIAKAIQGISFDIAGLRTTIAEREEQLAAVRAELVKLEGAEERRRELERESDVLQGEIQDLQKELGQSETRLAKAREMLQAEDKVLDKCRQLEAAKERVAVLRAKLPRMAALTADYRRLDQETVDARIHLEDLAEQIRGAQEALANREELEGAAAEYRDLGAKLEQCDEQAEQQSRYQTQRQEIEKNLDVKLTEKAFLKRQLEGLQEKTAMLSDSGCLDPDRAACRFLADAQEAKTKIADTISAIWGIDGVIAMARNALAAQDEQILALDYDSKLHTYLRARTRELKPKAELAGQLEAKAQLLSNLQDQQRQAVAAQDKLVKQFEAVQAERRALTLELQELPDLETRIPSLQEWASVKEKLPVARRIVDEEPARVAAINGQIAAKQQRLSEVVESVGKLLELAPSLASRKEQADDLAWHLERDRSELSKRQADLGGQQQRLESLKELKREEAATTARIAEVAREQSRYQILTKAFGRDGIPALIVENAVPELEDIANDLLGRMTNGAMRVRFETQRELKSVKGALAETLDIIISTWQGERPYESFSGGEQFRIDFALRVALSKLLARRAGAQLKLLVLDEGIGSQDAEGRDRLVEAISVIQEDFAEIFVISHIDEMKGAFPQRIEVEPGPDGSTVKLIA